MKTAATVLSPDAGDFVVGNKTLTPRQTEDLLKERFAALETTMLDKFAEIGVVSVEG